MYAVSKQHYYYSKEYAVEVAAGGSDYAGCDMLEFIGEWDDPRDAVEEAIKVYTAWVNKEGEGREIYIAYGHNLDMIEGECESLQDVIQDIRDWASQEYDELDKCDYCGEIITSNDTWIIDGYEDDYTLCSQYCADKVYYHMFEELPEEGYEL